MGYNLEFGWLYDALDAIARGAAMTIFLIALGAGSLLVTVGVVVLAVLLVE